MPVVTMSAVRTTAPGRVNLIGEHTDYNDGFVLPLAIDRWVTIALRPRADARVSAYSADFDEHRDIPLDGRRAGGGWAEYVAGVARSLAADGVPVRGFDAVLQGDVPIGAGMSSSAALEIAKQVADALAAAGGVGDDHNAATLDEVVACAKAVVPETVVLADASLKWSLPEDQQGLAIARSLRRRSAPACCSPRWPSS